MHTKEWIIHAVVLLIVIFIFIRVFRQPGIRDWLLIFFMKAYISSFFGIIVVAEGLIDYPVRLLPKYFDNSLMFEYIAFPASCLLYNQTTLKSGHVGIVLQAILYSSVMTMVEVALERYTDVIRYHNWMWYHTLLTLIVTFLMVRYAIALVRKVAKEEARL